LYRLLYGNTPTILSQDNFQPITEISLIVDKPYSIDRYLRVFSVFGTSACGAGSRQSPPIVESPGKYDGLPAQPKSDTVSQDNDYCDIKYSRSLISSSLCLT
jgi:hypothetical protein